MKKAIYGLLGTIALIGCSSDFASSQEEGAAVADYSSVFDQGKEARAWMSTGSNHMFEASDVHCNSVIAELYKLGAVEVRVVDGDKMTEESAGEIAATLMAKLPADAAKRKALFDYEKELMEDVDKDQKREFVEIVFD